VLLIEDSAADADLTREALAGSARSSTVCVVRDAAAAFAFLRHEGAHVAAPRPDLILLDLDLPGVDGRGVLRELKRDPELGVIPVVMLTSSTAPEDATLAYQAGANCYVHKPVELEQYLAAVRAIEHFWLAVVTLP
jgi:CheY-like chemotaxis protein